MQCVVDAGEYLGNAVLFPLTTNRTPLCTSPYQQIKKLQRGPKVFTREADKADKADKVDKPDKPDKEASATPT
jgi:hypothetical protein